MHHDDSKHEHSFTEDGAVLCLSDLTLALNGECGVCRFNTGKNCKGGQYLLLFKHCK